MAKARSDERHSPLRLLVFLLLAALLLAYAADRWERYHEATFGARDGGGILAVLERDRPPDGDEPGPTGAEAQGDGDEAVEEGLPGPGEEDGEGTGEALDSLLGEEEAASLTGDEGILPEATAGAPDFTGHRLERDRVRSRQLDLLLSVVQDPDAGSEARAEAREELLRLHAAMTVESELEHLLRLRGYPDAFVLRHREGVIVAVAAPDLALTEVRTIATLVQQVAGVEREGVGIMSYGPAG